MKLAQACRPALIESLIVLQIVLIAPHMALGRVIVSHIYIAGLALVFLLHAASCKRAFTWAGYYY
ncbi:hypothetical protein QBC46DRAFT_29537 [Diplogelasinospora grovesii]|uniref:Uncharacterized protein n=1 Tax=Diplogelasinospora grovesii TaxID=303347 RepID=A0AAN6NEP0_9PEZI|nr:hypothetical protein QBC46DRAFT_29537 [Diplogelasinospora grovesii]